MRHRSAVSRRAANFRGPRAGRLVLDLLMTFRRDGQLRQRIALHQSTDAGVGCSDSVGLIYGHTTVGRDVAGSGYAAAVTLGYR